MHDHAVTARDLLGGVTVTGGKDRGYEEGVCGLDSRPRMWKVDGKGVEGGMESIKEIGVLAVMICSLVTVRNKVVVSLSRGGDRLLRCGSTRERRCEKIESITIRPYSLLLGWLYVI